MEQINREQKKEYKARYKHNYNMIEETRTGETTKHKRDIIEETLEQKNKAFINVLYRRKF